jgi:hypothetical protein
LFGYALGSRDVASLAFLVTATEQDRQQLSAHRVVDPLTWAAIDLHFADAGVQHAMLAGISERQAADTCIDPCSCQTIALHRKPVLEAAAFDNLDHGVIVIYGLHYVNHGYQASYDQASA